MARMFFSTDAHGSTAIWKKWVNVPEFHKADMLLLCGDLTGKALIPLIQESDGTYKTHYYGRGWHLTSEKEVVEMENRLADSGCYPFRTTQEEVGEMRSNPKIVDEMMNDAMAQRIDEWLSFLVEKVDTSKVQVMAMPGNDDEFHIDKIIRSYEDRGVIWCLDQVVEVGGFETISLEYVNPTPWDTPREYKEKEMKKRIDQLAKKLNDPSKSIFNFHCPPYNTHLDLAPKLDKTLRPVVTAGTVEMIHVGSTAIREAEEQYQPMMGLHGHIHESYASDKIKNSVVVNPGSEYGEGILRGFIIEFSEEGVDRYWKVEG
ncbi:MAG: metallophosphoesterase [Theionarchaea archaeon]|nr:metallophosphoesterase [Theionarchaea archaeon]MBU7037788.1 metallophosphoesterase [Theionarchaea archaeon]